jgi:sporulation protein YlmC with PRC-barrel domain
MSEREVLVSRLLGCRVRDAAGRHIGRIEELVCEIELHAHGRDYVVREFQIGSFGRLDFMARGIFGRELLRTLGRASSYRQHRVAWDRVDLTDPRRPRLSYAISTST